MEADNSEGRSRKLEETTAKYKITFSFLVELKHWPCVSIIKQDDRRSARALFNHTWRNLQVPQKPNESRCLIFQSTFCSGGQQTSASCRTSRAVSVSDLRKPGGRRQLSLLCAVKSLKPVRSLTVSVSGQPAAQKSRFAAGNGTETKIHSRQPGESIGWKKKTPRSTCAAAFNQWRRPCWLISYLRRREWKKQTSQLYSWNTFQTEAVTKVLNKK